jgi:uncharacterized protein (DUF952 family)
VSAMAEQADLIYKILSVADWEAAKQAGRFEGSADDRRDGFIHFSDRATVIGTARKYFASQADLVLLAVDPTRLADLRWERSRDDALFPHLYGPLELDAVAKADRLPEDLDAADAIAALLGRLPPPGARSGQPAQGRSAGQTPVSRPKAISRLRPAGSGSCWWPRRRPCPRRRRSPPGRTRSGGRA